MSRRLTAGNDAPFVWVVKVQGQPFDLSGKDVKVYVINSRGEIPVASLNIEGNRVSGVFEGRYQTRLGGHSLILRINEGRPEMMTASVSNVFDLVQWSADAGGYDEGDVIIAPVVISSELRIGSGEGGGSYDDTAIWEALNDKVDKVKGKGLSTNDYTDAEKSKLARLENYDDTKLKEEIAETYATKDYVNEAVGNAGGGGEGCECATPDWSALEGKQGHILNRPCYFELSEMNIFETDVMAGSPYLTTMYGGDLFRFKVLGETFDIDLSGKEIPTYDYDHEIQNKLSYTFDIDTIRVSVDFYDAGDGVLTMEFGYVANEGESAPDELTLYVAEYVVNGRQRLSEGLIPQTIARKSELTELSAEMGKKQDTISDLADIRSGAAKGATALQRVPDTYATKTYVDDAISEIPQGGGEPSQYIKDASKSADGNTLTLTKKDGSIVSFSPSGGGGGSTADLTAVAKWGVLTQTLKKVGNVNEGYVVQVSNPVYGWIPQSFIDEVTSFGGIISGQSSINKPIFKSGTGYFEYRGITNLAYDEVRAGYMVGRNFFTCAMGYSANNGIAYLGNLAMPYHQKMRCLIHNPFMAGNMYAFKGCFRYKGAYLEQGFYNDSAQSIAIYEGSGIDSLFAANECLKIAGYFDMTYAKNASTISQAFLNCYSLEEVYFKALQQSVDFSQSPLLKEECILYMVKNAKPTSQITIKLHPTAKAKAEANSDIQNALASQNNVILGD